jgi:SPOR domain
MMFVHLSTTLRPRARLIGLMAGGASLVLLAAPVFVSETLAQTAQTAPPAVKKSSAKAKPKPADGDAEPAGSEASRDGNAAWRDYDAGVQLLRSAQPEAASEKFSKVLAGANVPAPLMAKTLLQRGMSYRQEGKPAQAVADLTSAMYLRNGLSEPEKADAAAQRSAAYREAGLTEQGVASPDQNRSTAVASGTAASGDSSSRMAASSVNGPVASLAPGAEAPAQSSSGGFFNKLFGSSESAAAAPAPTVAPAPPTAAVSAWSNPESAAPATGGKATKAGTKVATAIGAKEVLPWERPAGAPAADNPAPAKAKPAPKTAAVAAEAGSKASVPGGKFRLQLAAVMSREEAQASAARVKSQFGSDIGSRAATIDEAALGSSTMYIVRFGPYASAAEIKALCTRIRAAGTDCLQAP